MKTNRSCPMYSWDRVTEETEEERAGDQDEKVKILLRRQAISELGRIFGKIVTDITNIPNSWPFHLPVQEKIAPGYHAIVKNPMDFSTLRKNINNRRYSSANQFLSDVQLIHENCVTYNGAEHPFSMIALNVVRVVEEALEGSSASIKAAEGKLGQHRGNPASRGEA
ncbi:Transcription initiation factor TFIID subunit 1 [Mitosporidium daphniae]